MPLTLPVAENGEHRSRTRDIAPCMARRLTHRLRARLAPSALPRARIARARWIGPGRGYVDPLKEAQASTEKLANGTSNLEIECAEQGRDWEEVLEQGLVIELREKELRQQMGLEPLQ